MSTEKKLQLRILEGESKGTSQNQESPILKQSPAYVDDILNSVFSDKTLKEIELYRIEKLKNPQTIPTTEEQRKYTRAQHYINGEIAGFLRDSKKSKLEQSDEEYLKSLMRQMWLKQTSIITLRNEQYIDSFIDDLKCLHLKDPFLLEEYSKEYISEEVANTIDAGHPQEITTTKNGEIYFLLNYILEIHEGSSRNKEGLIRQYEFMKKLCYIKDANQEALLDHQIKYKLIYLDQIQYLPDFFKEEYNEFYDTLIKKYGITYINTIKNYTDHENNAKIEFSDEFMAHPDIALFYFIEQIISGKFRYLDDERLSQVIGIYKFDALGENMYFLFVTALIMCHGTIGYEYLFRGLYRFPLDQCPVYSWIFIIQGLLRYPENSERIMNDLLDFYSEDTLTKLFYQQYTKNPRNGEIQQNIPPDLENLIMGGISCIQYNITTKTPNTLRKREKLGMLKKGTESHYKENLISATDTYIYRETLERLASFYFDTHRTEQGLELIEMKLLSKIKTQKSDDNTLSYKSPRELMILIEKYKEIGDTDKANQWLQFGMQEGYDMKNSDVKNIKFKIIKDTVDPIIFIKKSS